MDGSMVEDSIQQDQTTWNRFKLDIEMDLEQEVEQKRLER